MIVIRQQLSCWLVMATLPAAALRAIDFFNWCPQ
jgi:hypothetical protein